MTIEFLKCRADLNFEVDFEVNGAIGKIVTKWDLFHVDNGSFSSVIIFFKQALHVSPFNIMKLNFQFKHFKLHKKSVKFFLALLILTCTIDIVSVVLTKRLLN